MVGSDGAFFFPIPAAFPIQSDDDRDPPPEPIAEMQQALSDLGYDPGPVTGDMSFKTRASLIAFQRDTGLATTGQIDVATLEAIPFALAALVQPQGGDELVVLEQTELPNEDLPPIEAEGPEIQDVRVKPCETCPELVRVNGGKWPMAHDPSMILIHPSPWTLLHSLFQPPKSRLANSKPMHCLLYTSPSPRD